MHALLQYIISLTVVGISYTAVAQSIVEWSFSYNEKAKVVEMRAEIQPGWHLYSQHTNGEVGPVATAFFFEENDQVKLLGKIKEPQSTQTFDPNFSGNVRYFEKEVVFTQKVKVKNRTNLIGKVTYMVCNDRKCLPPVDESFTISLVK